MQLDISDPRLVQILIAAAGLLLVILVVLIARRKRDVPAPDTPVDAELIATVSPGDAGSGANAGGTLGDVAGITPRYVGALRDAGIDCTEGLLARVATASDRAALAADLGLEDFVIRKWAGIADLLRIETLTPELAGRLTAIGIGSTQGLAQSNPDAVRNRLVRRLAQDGDSSELPTTSELSALIASARALPGILED